MNDLADAITNKNLTSLREGINPFERWVNIFLNKKCKLLTLFSNYFENILLPLRFHGFPEI